jgi:hypothetical protein
MPEWLLRRIPQMGELWRMATLAVRPLVAPHFVEQPRNGYALSSVHSTNHCPMSFKILVAENGVRRIELAGA